MATFPSSSTSVEADEQLFTALNMYAGSAAGTDSSVPVVSATTTPEERASAAAMRYVVFVKWQFSFGERLDAKHHCHLYVYL